MNNLHKIQNTILDAKILAVIWWFQTFNSEKYTIKLQDGDIFYSQDEKYWHKADAINVNRWEFSAHLPWLREGKPYPNMNLVK